MNYTSIAISGLPGAGKSTLVKKLSDFLSWKTDSIGEMFRKKHEVWAIGRPEITFENYWANHVTDKEIFQINEEARKSLIKGRLILDSRYAPVNAKGLENTFLLFLTCPVEIRAERHKNKKQYLGKNEDEIIEHLNMREQEELRRGQELYGKVFGGTFDYRNEKLYNLTIDTSKLFPNQEAELILKEMNTRQ